MLPRVKGVGGGNKYSGAGRIPPSGLCRNAILLSLPSFPKKQGLAWYVD